MKIFHGYFLGNLFGSLWLPMARVQILLVIYIEWENGENRSAVVQTVWRCGGMTSDQQCVVMQHLCERRDKKRRVFNLENVNLLQGGKSLLFLMCPL